jgi:carboxymethylenebutenolidase
MGKMIQYETPDGGGCPGYCAEPAAGDRAPGLVVLQEWWGLNENIRGVADRLAANGYRALVPDLYRGKVTLEAAEAAHLMGGLDFVKAVTHDVRGAVQYLRGSSRKVGVIGFCMGGALSIVAAMHLPDVDAVSCWYGIPPPEAGDPGAIRMPIQGHFALLDTHFLPAMVDALEARLKEGGVVYDFYRYPAGHGFAREGSASYHAESARLAWQRTFDFLAKHCAA